MSAPTFTVEEVVKALRVTREALQYTCNVCGIRLAADDTFEYPSDPAERERFHRILASRPTNPAERLRHDLGSPVRR